MKTEKLVVTVSKYLFATSVIMLLGVIRSDGMQRGFPMFWMIGRHGEHVMADKFVISFVIVLALVVAADVVTQFIIRTREPELKFMRPGNHYEVKQVAKTIKTESTESEVKTYNSEAEDRAAIQQKLKQIPRLGANKKDKNEKSENVGAIISLIVVLLSLGLTFFAGDDSEEYDYELGDADFFVLEEGDVYYEAEDSEAAIEPVQHELQSLFEAIEGEALQEYFPNDERNDALYGISNWGEIFYDDAYTYVSVQEGFAISKFNVDDDEGNSYCMAVLMEIAENELWDEENPDGEYEYTADVKGLAVCPYTEEVDLFYAEDNEKLLDAENYISAYSVNLGQTEFEGMNILLWRDGIRDLHIEAEGEMAV